MELQTECIGCNIQQVLKVIKNINAPKSQQKKMMAEVLTMLSTVDYHLCNPEVMKKTWEIICRNIGDPDPYQDIKKKYNMGLLAYYSDLKDMALASEDAFTTALKMSVLGNIIDFSANEGVGLDIIYQTLLKAEQTELSKDDSLLLKNAIKKAGTIVYIGDNCGEIVLDKLFIEVMKQENNCDIHYIVREKPIINDVTLIDAKMIKMEEQAMIQSSGDSSLGLVMSNTNLKFQQLFNKADVIIAKGQGNFEGLYDTKKENMFHLFMVKCDVIERIIGQKQNTIVCIKK